MTKEAALQKFFSGFGMTAYAETEVPDGAELPYLSYTPYTAAFGDGDMALTVKLWFYTESEAIPNAKAAELSRAIGRGGKMLPCDGGAVWLKRGSPWCQSLTDASDRGIKCRYINVSAEYLTSD